MSNTTATSSHPRHFAKHHSLHGLRISNRWRGSYSVNLTRWQEFSYGHPPGMIQLLVHAGAPSAKQDDERYRAQAKAYAAFQGCRRISWPTTTDGMAPSSSSLPDREHAVPEPPSMANLDSTTFVDDTQLAYDALDSQLVTSSLRISAGLVSSGRPADRISSSRAPAVPDKNIEPIDVGEAGNVEADRHSTSAKSVVNQPLDASTASSERSPHEDNSYSSYLKSPVLTRSARKRRLSESPRQTTGSSKRVRSTFPLPAGYAVAQDFSTTNHPLPSVEEALVGDQQASLGSDAALEITSELPTSYSLSNISTDSGRARRGASVSQWSWANGRDEPQVTIEQEGMAAPNETEADGASFHPASIQDLVEPSRKSPRSRPFQPVATSEDRTNVNPADEAHDVAAAVVDKCSESKDLCAILSRLPVSVLPPEPKVGMNSFTTHVTDTLQHLAKKLDMEKYYKPVSVSRSLRTLERGHWSVDCSSWEFSMQIEFWQFIEKAIRRGNLGWAVWCTRGEDGDDGRLGASTKGPSRDSIGTVRVFCWGEMVKHIYLMLYVASKAKVRKLGLQWIDAEGQVVVQMRNC